MVCVGVTDTTVEWDVPCNMSACDRKQGVRACKGEGSSEEYSVILTCLRGMLCQGLQSLPTVELGEERPDPCSLRPPAPLVTHAADKGCVFPGSRPARVRARWSPWRRR